LSILILSVDTSIDGTNTLPSFQHACYATYVGPNSHIFPYGSLLGRNMLVIQV